MRDVRAAFVGGPMYDGLYDAIPAFERERDVRVDIVAQLPHPELNAFVKQAFETGNPLDVISTHTKYAPSQARWLSTLDDVVPAGVVQDLLPRPLELSRIDGRLLQIPRNLDVRLLHYRSDLIAEPPRTWTDLIAVAASVASPHSSPPCYGFLFPGRDSGLFGTFYELLACAGGELFDADLRPAFDSDAGRWAIERIVELHHERRVTPRDLDRWHYDEISASFRAGEAAMVCDWPGSYHLYRDPVTCSVADRVELALLPTGRSGRRAAYAGCHSFAITRSARDREAAIALIDHLTSFEAQLAEARHGAIPCRASALAAIGTADAGDARASGRWRLLAETEPTMIIPPRFAAYPQCEDALWRAVQRAMVGELPAAEAIRRAASDVRQILASEPLAHR